MPVDLSQLSREELFAYKQAKSARDAARYKKKVEAKKEARISGIPMIVAPPTLPPMKKRFQSDYEENYGDFNPNYQFALAEAKRLDYDIDEWKEAWDEENQRLHPKKEIDEDPTKFAEWKGLLRNRSGDILTKDYEWVGKLIVKIKGGKGHEEIKRTTPPDYLQDTSLGTITEERFAEIVKEIAKPPDKGKQEIADYNRLTTKLRNEAFTQVFGHPLSIQEIAERQIADERAGTHKYAILENKAYNIYYKLLNEATRPNTISFIESGDE